MSGARPRSIDESESNVGATHSALVVAVISGGDPLLEAECSAARAADVIIAADSGLDLAAGTDLRVDTVIGDFDSVTAAAVARAEKGGTEIIRHSPDKDETDLELAMMRAVELGASRIVVVGLAGGRPDHAFSSLVLLADGRWSSAEVTGFVGDTLVSVLRSPGLTIAGPSIGHWTLRATPGDLLSLLPYGGDAVGVTTTGVRWELDDAILPASSPRGMSNIVEDTVVDVWLRSGTLLVFQPPGDVRQPGDVR